MGLPVKNLRDGTIKVQVANDGGGNAGEVEVKLEEGNLSWSEARPVEIISDRGTLDHARRGDEQLIELTFSMMYSTHLDPNSATPTVYEALTRQGAAAAWVSQNFGDSDDYSVNLEFIIADPAGGTDEEINFDLFNVTNIEFTEETPFDTLVVTGTAPLYWVDFWWKAEDSINPRIGSHGTFTRASTATFINSDGEVDYARSGEFRSAHHPNFAGRTGRLEAQRTNIALMSEELGGANWAATNVTVADDAVVSPDGFTTAETLTASAGNGTLINDLGALGAVDYVFSIWLKRKTGTGDIDLTLDNGASWTTVAVTSSWALFEITQSLANPDAGIRIVTNADAVWAWGGQVEAATFASSYIPTTVYPLSQDGFLEFSGAAGNYASTPDHNRLDIVGDIDIRARVAPDDWTPAAINTILSKWLAAADFSYLLRIAIDGTLDLSWTTDGTGGTVVTVASSVVTGFTDGTIHWVRATLDVATGNVNFYTSDDGDSWTQLGAADQGGGGATSIFSGGSVLEVGSDSAGTDSPFDGKIYRAQVFDGIAGTLVFDADPQDVSTHGVTRITLTEKENSAVVTVFSTSSAATRVKDVLFFPLPRAINTPKESTWYYRLTQWVNAYVSGTIMHIGSATAAVLPRWDVDVDASGDILAEYFGNVTDAVTSVVSAPSDDETVEFRTTLSSVGVVGLGSAIDHGAEVVETPGVGDALGAAWAGTFLYVNSTGSTVTGFGNYSEIKGARRTRTLEHLRKMG